MPGNSLFTKAPKGAVRLSIQLSPKGSRNKVGEPVSDAEGNLVLKASVTAIPENGKANTALIKMLAKAWKLPKSSLSIVSGATDR
ncbi:MAG: DUF167 domain-containing protein [Rhodospirillales bacterium]|nr:DUF167 domain-containing protein [Rhodospirillales bacterium]